MLSMSVWAVCVCVYIVFLCAPIMCVIVCFSVSYIFLIAPLGVRQYKSVFLWGTVCVCV